MELRVNIEALAASYGMVAPVVATLKGGSLLLTNEPRAVDTAEALKGVPKRKPGRKIPR